MLIPPFARIHLHAVDLHAEVDVDAAGDDPDEHLEVLIGQLVSEKTRRDPTMYWLSLIARLKPGATVDQADAEVQVLWRAFLRSVAAAAPASDSHRWDREGCSSRTSCATAAR